MKSNQYNLFLELIDLESSRNFSIRYEYIHKYMKRIIKLMQLIIEILLEYINCLAKYDYI